MRTKFIMPLLLLALFYSASQDVAAQEAQQYISVVYNSLDDYLENKMSRISDFVLYKTKEDQAVEFGAHFEAKPVDPSNNRTNVISIKKTWGMEQDGVLYMNVQPINNVHLYTPVETRGRYLLAFVHAVGGKKGEALGVEKGDLKKIKKDIDPGTQIAVGLAFGMIGGALMMMNAGEMPIIPVIIDTQEKSTKAFTTAYGQMLAERHPEMSYRYEYTGSANLDKPALIKYINDLNNLAEGGTEM